MTSPRTSWMRRAAQGVRTRKGKEAEMTVSRALLTCSLSATIAAKTRPSLRRSFSTLVNGPHSHVAVL